MDSVIGDGNIYGNTAGCDSRLDGTLMEKLVRGGAARLRSNVDEINGLNVFPVPDGDTGSNMCMTMESGVVALDGIESDKLSVVASALARGMLIGARGNSGVILSQIFDGIAKCFEGCDDADPVTVGNALRNGVKQAYKAVVTPTEGTILTVARESVEYATQKLDSDATVQSLFSDLMSEMKHSLVRTPELLPVLKEAGVVDSGGAGLLHIIEGFNGVLNGEEISDNDQIFHYSVSSEGSSVNNSVSFESFGADSEMTYGYCTELLLRLQNSKTDVASFDENIIKDYISTVGDSVVIFKTGSIVKLHVHTMTPDKVLAKCREYGEFLTVKIENMSLQHSGQISFDEKKPENKADEPKQSEHRKYATVAVCSGSGTEQVFRELGADCIISGGQTNNPSAGDFIAAFDSLNAEHIFVFPNNGNIMMAAKQAAEMYGKSDVRVLPSKDLGTGYAGLAAADLTLGSADEIESMISESMQNVKTGYVSVAVRNAVISGVDIKNGAYIGFSGKDMISSEPDKNAAALELADRLLSDGSRFMVTVFCGADVSEKEKNEFSGAIAEKYGEIESYFIDGGQEVYSYIIVAE